MTEEQWERIIRWHFERGRWLAVQGLVEAKQFVTSMERLQSLAGYSPEQMGELSQAILDLASTELLNE